MLRKSGRSSPKSSLLTVRFKNAFGDVQCTSLLALLSLSADTEHGGRVSAAKFQSNGFVFVGDPSRVGDAKKREGVSCSPNVSLQALLPARLEPLASQRELLRGVENSP